jgi:hypothetical protein
MIVSKSAPSQMAGRRVQREKRRVIMCWSAGLFLLVAAVAALLVAMYMTDLRH